LNGKTHGNTRIIIIEFGGEEICFYIQERFAMNLKEQTEGQSDQIEKDK